MFTTIIFVCFLALFSKVASYVSDVFLILTTKHLACMSFCFLSDLNLIQSVMKVYVLSFIYLTSSAKLRVLGNH